MRQILTPPASIGHDANPPRFLAIGTMSGTSMDGIDVAIIETDGHNYARHISGSSIRFNPVFQLSLRMAEFAVQQENGKLDLAHKNFSRWAENYVASFSIDQQLIRSISQEFGLPDLSAITLDNIIQKFTRIHALLIKDLLYKNQLASVPIEVVGFHGQNLYHNPKKLITIQVGDGQLLADIVGIPVINNFRENDVKNGGQGAPFAPLYHQVLAGQKGLYPLAIVNCGGIANITIITGSGPEQIIGFDTGPGNILIDRYVRLKTQNREVMDENGKYGSKGKVNPEIILLLKKQALAAYDGDYFNKFPPKSLDSGNFQLPASLMTLAIEDGCANLAAFTAESIVESLDLVKLVPPGTWILAGGGWQNPVITEFFKKSLYIRLGGDVKILSADDYGFNSGYMEAEIFAYLAARSLLKLPISLPGITGVKAPMTGGDKYLPQL